MSEMIASILGGGIVRLRRRKGFVFTEAIYRCPTCREDVTQSLRRRAHDSSNEWFGPGTEVCRYPVVAVCSSGHYAEYKCSEAAA